MNTNFSVVTPPSVFIFGMVYFPTRSYLHRFVQHFSLAIQPHGCTHLSFSPPSPPMSCSARSSFLAQRSILFSRSTFFCLLASSFSWSFASFSCTCRSDARFFSRAVMATASSSSAAFRAIFLGATTLATLENKYFPIYVTAYTW